MDINAFPLFPPPFDPDHTDKEVIEEKHLAPCRFCWDAYREVVWTGRYCVVCGRAACQSKHLTFHANRAAFCLVHGGKN